MILVGQVGGWNALSSARPIKHGAAAFERVCAPSKHWVDIVEMWLLGVCKEELTAIGVWAFVGHGKNSPIIVLCGPHKDASRAASVLAVGGGACSVYLQVWVKLVSKVSTPNAFSAFACACWVATLDHEGLDIPMELCVVVGAREC